MIRWLILFLLCFTARAATNTIASNSSTDWQNAINAASDGDTLLVPAGSATWTTGVTCQKYLHILGPDARFTTSPTAVITINVGSGNGFQVYNRTNGSAFIFWLKGLTFIHSSATSDIEVGSHSVAGGFRSARISDIVITNCSSRGITTAGDLSVCIDHCWLIAPGSATLISTDGDDDGGGSPPYNPRAWANPFPGWGTTNGVVCENNKLSMLTTIANGALDSYAGAITTMRFNLLTNGNIGGHGLDSSGSYRSPLAFEVYGNTNYGDAGFSKTYYNFRGGALITYSNWVFAGNASDSCQTFIALFRTSGTNDTYPSICCSPWGSISDLLTNRYDGNQDMWSYPALDQMGYVGPTTFSSTNSTQVQMPMYAWQNFMVKSGATTDVSFFSLQVNVTNSGIYNGYDLSHIPPVTKFYIQGRDYFTNTVAPSSNYVALVYPHPFITTLEGGGGGGSSPGPSRKPTLRLRRP